MCNYVLYLVYLLIYVFICIILAKFIYISIFHLQSLLMYVMEQHINVM